MKTLLISLVVFAVIASATAMLTLRTQNVEETASGRPSATIPVVVAEVTPGIFADRIEALGTTTANESVAITADVTGRVVTVNFHDGKQVKKGDTLIELDSDEERASLTAAQANLTTQKTQHKRLEDLIRQKSAAQTTLDEQANTLKRAVADLEIARVRLEDRSIQAPFDGQLGIRRVSPGALVTPGDEIVTLDDLSVMKLDFSVPETVLSSLQRGLDIMAESVAYPDHPFAGKVTTIGTRIDPVTRTVVVRAELPNNEGLLKPGMLLTVNLLSNLSEALQIPEESLIPINDKQFVYRVTEHNRVERIEVHIGRRQPGTVEVLKGLSIGEIVVIEGTTRVDPETPINIVGTSNSPVRNTSADTVSMLKGADNTAEVTSKPVLSE